jgi:hypothetical protein
VTYGINYLLLITQFVGSNAVLSLEEVLVLFNAYRRSDGQTEGL